MLCFKMIMEQSVILTKMYRILENCSIMTLMLITLVIAYVILYKWKRERLVKLIDKLPGPPGFPLIGNAIEINVEHDGKNLFYYYHMFYCHSYHYHFNTHFIVCLVIMILWEQFEHLVLFKKQNKNIVCKM